MKHSIQIDCPSEVLISLHEDIEQFAELMKLQTAIYLKNIKFLLVQLQVG